jgi:hypothetical protein
MSIRKSSGERLLDLGQLVRGNIIEPNNYVQKLLTGPAAELLSKAGVRLLNAELAMNDEQVPPIMPQTDLE